MSQSTRAMGVTIDPHIEQRIPMSYEEFLDFAADIHAEWVDGEAIVFMPPTTIHQQITGFLYILVSLFVRSRNLGDVMIAPYTMRVRPAARAREPDVLFVAREHAQRLTPEGLEGPADLIVEVVSESSVERDHVSKFSEYQEAGVREYWIIDPRSDQQRADFYQLLPHGVYQLILPDTDGRYHANVLPGFWLQLDWLWQQPLPDPLSIISTITGTP